MLFTFLAIAAGLGITAAVIAFWQELQDWAKEQLSHLISDINECKVLLARTASGIIRTIRFIYKGKWYDKHEFSTQQLTDQEIDEMVPDPLTPYQASMLKEGLRVDIGTIYR